MEVPYFYEQLNNIIGHASPSTLKYDSASYQYFRRSLIQRMFSIFDFELPDTWNADYFNYILFGLGFVIVIDGGKYGVVPQHGTLSQFGIYYQPTEANIATQFFNKPHLKIWKDCGLIKLTPDYVGAMDIVDFYAQKLASLDSTLNQSIVNSRMAYIIGAKDKSGAQTIKAALDEISKGNPAVVYDESKVKGKGNTLTEDDPWSFLNLEVNKNYITDKVLDNYREILNQFDTEVGIPNNQQSDKKERLVTNEVETNNAETVARATTWEDCLKASIKRTNELYGLNISVKRREYDTGNTGAVEAGKVERSGDDGKR